MPFIRISLCGAFMAEISWIIFLSWKKIL